MLDDYINSAQRLDMLVYYHMKKNTNIIIVDCETFSSLKLPGTLCELRPHKPRTPSTRRRPRPGPWTERTGSRIPGRRGDPRRVGRASGFAAIDSSTCSITQILEGSRWRFETFPGAPSFWLNRMPRGRWIGRRASRLVSSPGWRFARGLQWRLPLHSPRMNFQELRTDDCTRWTGQKLNLLRVW